ncbi:hypothetical protein vBAspATola_13 [Aeromonas phage vB_AspA_Tola]|nr:hypothetical protein vBAspATola_13 [Aeromonas phage vB_AspA_Tola]
MNEYQKALYAISQRELYLLVAAEQAKGLTFKPSDFHNLSCKPMRVKR